MENMLLKKLKKKKKYHNWLTNLNMYTFKNIEKKKKNVHSHSIEYM